MAENETEVQDEKQEEGSEESSTAEQELESSEQSDVNEAVEEEAPSNELQLRVKELTDQKSHLTSLVDRLVDQMSTIKSSGGEEEEEEESDLSPEDRARKKNVKVVQERLQRFENTLGRVMDDMDRISIQGSPLGSSYNKYSGDVEALRAEKIKMGRYLTREEALALVLAKKQMLGQSVDSQKKRVVKQAIKPAGETKSASGGAKEKQAQKSSKNTPEERLQGLKF